MRTWISVLVVGALVLGGQGPVEAKHPKHAGKHAWKEHRKGGPPAHAKAWGRKKSSERMIPYVYYPDWQVYRNEETGKFYWLEKGEWHIGIGLPKWVRLRRARTVRVELPTMTPFSRHAELFREYPPDPKKWKQVRGYQGPPDHAPAWGWRRKHGGEFEFYPERGVWYDHARKKYLWLEAGKWKIGMELPKEVSIEGLGKVRFDF